MQLLQIYIAILLFLFGACMGSFITCAAGRYIAKESVLKGRSHCPVCGKTLGPLELIPIFSYLFLRGRCRGCGAPIPVRCFFTELITGALYLVVFLRYGITFVTLEYLILFSVLLAIALIDCDTSEIPDGLNLSGVLVFLAFYYPHGDLAARAQDAALGAVIYGGGMLLLSLFMDLLLKRETLGGGDVKLFAMLGLYTGVAKGVVMILLACVAGLLLSLRMKKGRQKEFPFGPAISVAAIVTLLFGQEIVNLYLSLIPI